MRTLLQMLTLSFVFCHFANSQNANVTYSFYIDANNDCTYQATEQIVKGVPGNIQLTYVNTGATTSNAYAYASPTVCFQSGLSVNSYSTPATNTLFVNVPAIYPG